MLNNKIYTINKLDNYYISTFIFPKLHYSLLNSNISKIITHPHTYDSLYKLSLNYHLLNKITKKRIIILLSQLYDLEDKYIKIIINILRNSREENIFQDNEIQEIVSKENIHNIFIPTILEENILFFIEEKHNIQFYISLLLNMIDSKSADKVLIYILTLNINNNILLLIDNIIDKYKNEHILTLNSK